MSSSIQSVNQHFCCFIAHFFTTLTHGCSNSRVEYEIIPSVNAITAKSRDIYAHFVGGLMLLLQSSFTAKRHQWLYSSSPIIISQVSTSSILMIKFSLKGMSLSNKAFIYILSLPTLT
jgi:hypothetical protein